VNEDLAVDYKNVEVPATERFFDTYGGIKEETKQSINNMKYYENRKTSREVNNTDSSLYEGQITKMNNSYMSDNSVKIGDINKTDGSYIFQNTTDSMEISKNKVNLNLKIHSRLQCKKARSRRAKERNKNNENGIQISSLIKRKGLNRNFNNFMSIKESEIEEKSRPASPYFSSSFKNLKSNPNADPSQISDNPLASATAFQKKLSIIGQKIDKRHEMSIFEGSNQLQPQVIEERNLATNLIGFHKNLMSMSCQTSLKDKESMENLQNLNNMKECHSKLIIPNEKYMKKRVKSRKTIFEES